MDIARIKLIRDDVSVWLIYAGAKRRYFNTFRETGKIFLQLPGFNASEAVFQSDELIRRHLAMSDQILRYVRGTRPSPPGRNASAYSPHPYASNTTEANSFNAELGNISRLFKDAKVGDLVLSPAEGHFAPLMIGEIRHAWRKADDLELSNLSNEVVPTRSVQWLDTALARRDFSARVSRRLQNKHAITLVDDRFYEDIFRSVYPSYVWKNTSKVDIFGDKYASKDPLQPYQAAFLIKYVIASALAYEGGEFADFQSLSQEAAIQKYYNLDAIDDFTQNFNSPGKFSLIAKVAAISILVSAGLAVATAESTGSFNATQTEVIANIKSALAGSGKAPFEAKVDDYVSSMSATTWKPVQRSIGTPAAKNMGLSLNNRVELEQHKAALNAK